MTYNRMYSQRIKQNGNISVIRTCPFDCTYCAFKRFRAMSKCEKCRANESHSHLEVLQRKPPRTKEGEFLTVGLAGDISFMNVNEFCSVLDYCSKWGDRTFLIQSKNPEFFLQFAHKITSNIVIGTTIETNRTMGIDGIIPYGFISNAPYPERRYEAMLKLNCRKSVTIEPILSFSEDIFVEWVTKIRPEFVYVGYNSRKGLNLPEPILSDTLKFISRLRNNGIEVREKLLRRAFYE